MKKLLRLLMILLLTSTLVGCLTTEEVPVYEVPDFSMTIPKRPKLEEIPQDTSGALKALTNNMRALVAYTEKLEITYDAMDNYYRTVIEIITR